MESTRHTLPAEYDTMYTFWNMLTESENFRMSSRWQEKKKKTETETETIVSNSRRRQEGCDQSRTWHLLHWGDSYWVVLFISFLHCLWASHCIISHNFKKWERSLRKRLKFLTLTREKLGVPKRIKEESVQLLSLRKLQTQPKLASCQTREYKPYPRQQIGAWKKRNLSLGSPSEFPGCVLSRKPESSCG